MANIKLNEIPENLLKEMARRIYNHTIGFVVVNQQDREETILKGSGTLICIDGLYGILTAEHVIKYLPKKGDLGFIISDRLHKFTINSSYLNIYTIAKSDNPADGPDIGFILLPESELGQFKASKSFYDLGKRIYFSENPPEIDLGVWCISGFPEELACNEGPGKGFSEIKRFTGFCGFVRDPEQYSSGDFDYYEFEVPYNKNIGLPTNFEGVSGGGLWQVIIAKAESNELFVKDIILSGIPFYQTEFLEDKKKVKCHGRKSIYQYSIEFIKNGCS